MIRNIIILALPIITGIGMAQSQVDTQIINDVRTSVTRYFDRIPNGPAPGEAGKALMALPPALTLPVLIDAYQTSKTELLSDREKKYIFLNAVATFNGANDPVGRQIMTEHQNDSEIGWFITKQLTGVNPLNDPNRAAQLMQDARATSLTRDQNLQILMSAGVNPDWAKKHLGDIRAMANRPENDGFVNAMAYRALANAEDYSYLLDLTAKVQLPDERSEIYRYLRVSTVNNGCKITSNTEYLNRLKDLIMTERVPMVRRGALLALTCFIKTDPDMSAFLTKVEALDKTPETHNTITMIRNNM